MNKLKTFIIPKTPSSRYKTGTFSKTKIVVLVPAHKPPIITLSLIKEVTNYPNVTAIVIDDCTPIDSPSITTLNIIRSLSKKRNVTVIKTPNNLLKAGALNWGLSYIKKNHINPDVVITFDDDVVISKNTLPKLINFIYEDDNTVAVCSNALIINKNNNLLTRLQSLEYHGFNITKLSDNGFYCGPLVLPGMLSAFKYFVLRDIKFDSGNLIEDYEITAKIKKAGWTVALAPESWASTDVPEKFSDLWRQRVRWTYGGLTVLARYYRFIPAVLQDLVGHSIFISLAVLISFSFAIDKAGYVPIGMLKVLYVMIFLQFAVSYLFSIYSLRHYKNADWIDHIIRLTILPELIYGSMLGLILFGSYLFFLYNKFFQALSNIQTLLYKTGLIVFNKVGFSLSWGTRELSKEVNHNE